MTKCIVIGEETKKTAPITFELVLNTKINRIEGQFHRPAVFPTEYQYIELLKHGATSDHYDVMLAHNGSRKEGCIYLGHWNGGIV